VILHVEGEIVKQRSKKILRGFYIRATPRWPGCPRITITSGIIVSTFSASLFLFCIRIKKNLSQRGKNAHSQN